MCGIFTKVFCGFVTRFCTWVLPLVTRHQLHLASSWALLKSLAFPQGKKTALKIRHHCLFRSKFVD